MGIKKIKDIMKRNGEGYYRNILNERNKVFQKNHQKSRDDK